MVLITWMCLQLWWYIWASAVTAWSSKLLSTAVHTRTHAHTRTHPFNGPLSRTTWVSRYQKGKPIWILLKQETMSGKGIHWAICKSAPRSRQITTPASHHSVFYRPDALPAANQQRQSTKGKSTEGNCCIWSLITFALICIKRSKKCWVFKMFQFSYSEHVVTEQCCFLTAR